MSCAHEYQRPDRDKYIEFDPEKLKGYKEAKYQARIIDGTPFKPGMTVDQKVDLACKSIEAAKKLSWHYIVEYIPDIRRMGEEPVYSQEFDFHSIMMYCSRTYSNADESYDDPDGWVIYQTGEREGNKRGRPKILVQGGAVQFRYAGPSELDEERLQMLYPVTLYTPGSSDQGSPGSSGSGSRAGSPANGQSPSHNN